MKITETTLKEAFPNAEIRKKRTTGRKYSEISYTIEFGDTNGFAKCVRTTFNASRRPELPLSERQEKWRCMVAKYVEPRTYREESTIRTLDLEDDAVIPKIKEGMATLGIV